MNITILLVAYMDEVAYDQKQNFEVPILNMQCWIHIKYWHGPAQHDNFF